MLRENAPLSDAPAARRSDRRQLRSLRGSAGSPADVTVERYDETKAQLKIRREAWLFSKVRPGWRWARTRVAPDKVIVVPETQSDLCAGSDRGHRAMAILAGG